jgi:hypothetical protein
VPRPGPAVAEVTLNVVLDGVSGSRGQDFAGVAVNQNRGIPHEHVGEPPCAVIALGVVEEGPSDLKLLLARDDKRLGVVPGRNVCLGNLASLLERHHLYRMPRGALLRRDDRPMFRRRGQHSDADDREGATMFGLVDRRTYARSCRVQAVGSESTS